VHDGAIDWAQMESPLPLTSKIRQSGVELLTGTRTAGERGLSIITEQTA
jgi:hypothetical protein